MSSLARQYIKASGPRLPAAHLIATQAGRHLFVADGSRLFDIDADLFAEFEAALTGHDARKVASLLALAGLDGAPLIDDVPLAPPPIHALSLAVAQKCNLGCTYCYAEQGGFGGAPKNMPQETALQAVEQLIGHAAPGAKLNLSFLGGEPLVNRPVLQATTRHAADLARRKGTPITFSITTNGTLVSEADADFFEEHGFAVTISLDGVGAAHDAQRPYRDGRGSFDRIMRRIEPLLARQRRMQVSARVTVTPRNLDLRPTLDAFIAAGFHSVGFSPMLASPSGQGEMQAEDLALMLEQMIGCGREFERRTLAHERYPFANMLNAMREIGRGTHRPYPCGAGAGYLGVSASGDLAACHRFVDDADGAMGSLEQGLDVARQAAWLADRHVHRQEPCNGCWARYLCGGGCHHEVTKRGRPACDYIRGWLHYCLEAYLRLGQAAQQPLAG
ncbi:radical SAM/SPASM domain-containing protein [Aestuariivirga sp. YIM B02566]|uniref:Radical SAM protein n=1 Tax=Taklimakanibacter albus TaxID=2800327 RepID=A0ACC5RCN1_9HYPH|nr:radical SAM protein [Aestuariivirga sp. YIM B02566]